MLLFALNSCEKSNTDHSESQSVQNVISVIDTIHYMNELFYIEEVSLSLPNNVLLDFIISGAVDSENNLYLYSREIIYKFKKTGEYISRLQATGKGPGEYIAINSIAFDEHNNIYIAEGHGKKILVYSNNFKFIKSFKLKGNFNFTSLQFTSPDTIVCFAPMGLENSIYYFNTDLKLINQTGRIDELMIKYWDYYSGGGLDINNGKIYYSLTHNYKIFEINNGIENTIIDKRPGYFKELDFINENPLARKEKFSRVENLFCEDGIIIVNPFLESEEQRQHNINDEFRSSDIYTIDGKVIRTDVYFKGLTNIRKYGAKNYISIIRKFNTSHTSKSEITKATRVALLKYKF